MGLYDPELEVGSPLEAVLIAVGNERKRAETLRDGGRFTHMAGDAGISDGERLAMLVEEVGEVAQEVLTQPGRAIANDTTGSRASLRKELIHVACVAVSWVEGIDTGRVDG